MNANDIVSFLSKFGEVDSRHMLPSQAYEQYAYIKNINLHIAKIKLLGIL